MSAATLMRSSLWLTAGWVMLHFTWVGCALGLVTAVVRRVLRSAEPGVRYGFALLFLGCLAAAPPVISAWLPAPLASEPPPLQIAPGPRSTPLGLIPPGGPRPDLATSSPRPSEPRPPLSHLAPDRDPSSRGLLRVAALLPWLWLIGAPPSFLLLATGLAGVERLRRRSKAQASGPLPDLCRRLSNSLRLTRRVALGVCDGLATPILVGVVRPCILLPTAALAGWSPEQLEMILLHELAHVRRWDNLVNLLQRVIESVLFFHPVVWWVSGWVRLEREQCCDALVVAHTGRARAYAQTLAALALPGPPAARLASALGESHLVTRIRHLLNLEENVVKRSQPAGELAAAVVLMATALIGLLSWPLVQAAAPPAAVTPEGRLRDNGSLPPGLVLSDDIRRAVEAIEALRDSGEKAHSLKEIAVRLTKDGNQEAARAILQRAVRVATSIPPDQESQRVYFPPLLVQVAEAQARADDRAGARATLQRALPVATAVKEDIRRLEFLRAIVAAQAQMGDREAAQRTFDQAYRQAQQLQGTPLPLGGHNPLYLAGLRASVRDFEGAIRSLVADAKADPDPERQALILEGGLEELAKAVQEGDTAARPALRTAAQLSITRKENIFTFRLSQTQREIVHAQLRIGDLEGALQTPHLMKDGKQEGDKELCWLASSEKINVLINIADAQVDAGDRAGARKTLQEAARISRAVTDTTFKNRGPIAVALARVGDFEGAIQTNDNSNSMALAMIAQKQAEAGDRAAAEKTFQKALELARQTLRQPVAPDVQKAGNARVEQGWSQTVRQALLAEIQAMAGDFRGARATAEAIGDQNDRGGALSRIAFIQARAGDVNGALTWAGALTSPQLKSSALLGVANGVAYQQPKP